MEQEIIKEYCRTCGSYDVKVLSTGEILCNFCKRISIKEVEEL